MAGRSQGAHSVFDDGDRKKKGFPWWLLALLAIALIALVLLLRACGDDEDGGSGAAQPTPPAETQVPQEAAPAGGGAGSLTAGGQALLPATQAGALEDLVGEDATGERVRVQEVVQDEGFFVGTSEEDRVYVEYGGDVGETEEGSESYEPAVGDEVNLSGPVRPAPAEPEQTLNLDAADARVVSDQGIYVNAETVEPAA